MTDRHESGILDTCAYVDLDLLDPMSLPKNPEITTITLAELHQGLAMAKNSSVRAMRTEKLGAAIVGFDPLPFDGEAAARYGSLFALTIAAKRDPRPRKLDLMIAAIASVRDLPLYTRNISDFKGLDDLVTVIEV